ncbi:MAG: transglutaminase domain-containing protein [Bacteroidales bacterium]|nr:transglutaminase domain-containing protein [Bacteroidales bacterium]
MKAFVPAILLFLLPSIIFSQTNRSWNDVDRTMLSTGAKKVQSIGQLSNFINENFSHDSEKIRAMYVWLAYNIDYDTRTSDNLTREETDSEITLKTFQKRKGICEGYAGIMDSLCQLSAIPSHIISGYTRQEGEIDPLPHAWIAAQIDQYWYLFDPTWGAGSVINNRFVQQFDEQYFMVPPMTMINTHIPYDPIWQFLKFPISHETFTLFREESENHFAIFDYRDSIDYHLQLSQKEQWENELRRMSENDFSNKALEIRTAFLTEALYVAGLNKSIQYFNEATNLYNRGVSKYNDYAEFRNKNKQVSSYKGHLNRLLLEAEDSLSGTIEALLRIQNPPREMKQNMHVLRQNSMKLLKQIENERDTLY